MQATVRVALVVVGLLANANIAVANLQPTELPSYEEFVALDSQARRERLGQMRPEMIAGLKRTQAERWLAAHRDQLSPAQVAVFAEALEFISVEVYRQPNDPATRVREDLLTHRLTCVLGVENTRQAFVLHLPPEPVRAGWRSSVDAWLSWFFECVAP